MKATTPGIAVLLTCVVGASTVGAQAPQDGFIRVFELRQENNNTNSNKAQTQAEARQRANAEKAEAARQRRGGPARGGQRGSQSEASETFTRIVHLDRGATFDLRNGVGDVTITGGGGRELTAGEGRIHAGKAYPHYARIGVISSPWTSVSRKSRP